MFRVPGWVKRHPLRTALIVAYVAFSPIWGPVAEAHFTPEPRMPVRNVNYGLYMDESPHRVVGLRTRPAPYVEPVRATGTATAVPVRITEPRGDFWRALANCESPNGSSGRYLGYFQFHPGTWAATGGGDLGSYEHQKARAQQWASKVDPGSRAGWPVCWHRARAAVGYAPK